jgi:hypothetical protein
VSSQTPNQTNAAGTSANFARADHIHNISTVAPANQTVAAVAADGTSTSFSRSDHLHTFSTAAATTIGTTSTNTQGVSTSFSRADHVHQVTVGSTTVFSQTSFTITSATGAVVTGMTTTPAAGTYFVRVSGQFSIPSGGTNTATIQIAVGGAIVTDSPRTMGNTSGANAAVLSNGTETIVTVNGAQAVEMWAARSAATTTVTNRSLILLRIS